MPGPNHPIGYQDVSSITVDYPHGVWSPDGGYEREFTSPGKQSRYLTQFFVIIDLTSTNRFNSPASYNSYKLFFCNLYFPGIGALAAFLVGSGAKVSIDDGLWGLSTHYRYSLFGNLRV